jgi:hypothetical protein
MSSKAESRILGIAVPGFDFPVFFDKNCDIMNKTIVRLACTGGFLILAMFAVTILTGVSQERFEITKSVDAYTEALRAAENPLRLIFTIDLVFITVFTALFVILPQYLKTGEKVTDAIANTVIGAMLVCGFLDFYEDLHILTMLESALKNIPLAQSEIAGQMFFSMIKFCASYFALFLTAFLLPSRSWTEKLLKYSLWFFQLPIGILVYTAPAAFAAPLNFLRFAFMISGFFLVAYNFSMSED